VIRRPARELAGLSLVAGVAAARALRALASRRRAQMAKRLVVDGAKLGGILVETRGSFAVIGLGINCRRDAALENAASQTDRRARAVHPGAPNRLIERIAQSLLEALATFQARASNRCCANGSAWTRTPASACACASPMAAC